METIVDSGSVTLGVSASGVSEVVRGMASGATSVVKEFTIQPPSPHHGYDLGPERHDFIGHGVVLAFALGGLCAVFVVLRRLDL